MPLAAGFGYMMHARQASGRTASLEGETIAGTAEGRSGANSVDSNGASMLSKRPVPGIPDVLTRFGASSRLIQQAFVIALVCLAAFALACLLPVDGDQTLVSLTAVIAVAGVLLWLVHLVVFARRISGAAPRIGAGSSGRLARLSRIAGIAALAATGAPLPEPPDATPQTNERLRK